MSFIELDGVLQQFQWEVWAAGACFRQHLQHNRLSLKNTLRRCDDHRPTRCHACHGLSRRGSIHGLGAPAVAT